MPKGLPGADELFDKKSIGFFSIDTDVIQSIGYKFGEGALHALAYQCPTWITIQLTEVVQREVMNHRIEPVLKAVQELDSALKNVERLAQLDFTAGRAVTLEHDPGGLARHRYEQEFQEFVRRLRGAVLPIDGPTLARELFERYFAVKPPFESRKGKKEEFPDAAALLTLEEYAKSNKKKGVLISNDAGWMSFAEDSENLYCVKTLDEFTALFKSSGVNAVAVEGKIQAELNTPDSDLLTYINDEISDHVHGARWRVGDLYGGNVSRVEGAIYETEIKNFVIDLQNIGLWLVEHDPTVCIVELTVAVAVKVLVEVEFFVWDSIDRDELSMGSDVFERSVDLEIEVFLKCRGDLLATPCADWEITCETSGGRYDVDVGEVELYLGGED